MQNNRNSSIAIALSVLIVLGWQFLYMNPRIEAQRKAQEAQKAQQQSEQTQAPAGGQPAPHTSGAAPTGQAAATATREEALAKAPRIAIDTDALSGSVEPGRCPPRRPEAQRLSRDGRQEQPDHYAFLAG